ncbi:hypothetical protein KFK09_017977 [Dendrobium nobile]|uniref:Fe2OG dioxygenase domain-containing protein n=1 Tax=Dendrobium nobile TaxID=94219 RepID=A0A8T3ATY8_DENNO|nr:hypothetical protein KFK09_017977 [Dendrobium nobile]
MTSLYSPRSGTMRTAPATPLDLGCSVPVPNVQELAAIISAAEGNGAGEVPDRYVRPEAEADPVASPADGDELPVIDISKLINSEFLEEQELANLGFACREWGFFQVINHGVSDETINKMKKDMMEFFKLPLKEKEEIKQLPGGIQGYGQLFVQSEEQKLDWADLLVLSTHPFARRDIKFWPTNPTTFRDTLDKYSLELRKLTGCLVRLMAKDLGIKNPDLLGNLLSEHLQSVRINYYPPCKHASKVLGLSPHSDGTGLTVLLQANDVNGLQIKKDDRWFSVKARPGAFIVNIGDHIEIMSNGRYKSIEHRVVINKEKERLSIAAFHSPPFEVALRPFPELIEAEEERYRAITVGDFMKAYMTDRLDGKRLLESLKLKK